MNSEGQGFHKKADFMKDCLAFFMVAAGGDNYTQQFDGYRNGV